MSEATSSAPAGSVFVDDFEQGEQFDILGVIRVKVLVPARRSVTHRTNSRP